MWPETQVQISTDVAPRLHSVTITSQRANKSTLCFQLVETLR